MSGQGPAVTRSTLPGEPPPPKELCSSIVQAIGGRGWCVTGGFLAPAQVDALALEARAIAADGGFRAAGVGRAHAFNLRTNIRGDRIAWIDPQTAGPAVRDYLVRLDGLREVLNRELFLGLFDFEGHLTSYPPGSFYGRHLDQFRGVERRTLSCILYLNRDWQPGDGGELRIYTDMADTAYYEEVVPLGGTLVTFLSAHFEHEVHVARRERLSLTGWFRRRA